MFQRSCRRSFAVVVALIILVHVLLFLLGRNSPPAPLPTNPRIDDAFAFATFLGADSGHSEDKNGVDEDDDYFMSVRQLVYQLLHSAKAAHLPVLVLCTPEVAPSKIVKLEADGATIVNVQQVRSSWLHTSEPRWADMLTKLQLFGLTNFTKICYLDADTLVLGDLSGIFHDPATAFQSTLADAPQARLSEIQLPESYTLAGHIDYGWYTGHVLSTEIGADAYMNAGFFVFAPSQALFDYYSALLEHQGLFDPYMMEQSLLNYAHHRQSNMPWQPLSPMWNVNWPTKQDLDAGVLSFHDKYWEGGNTMQDATLAEVWKEQRREMMEYYERQANARSLESKS